MGLFDSILGSGSTSTRETSRRDAFSQGSTFVDPLQIPFLQQLRGTASDVALGQVGEISNVAGALSGALGQVGAGALGQLGAGNPALAGIIQQLGAFSPAVAQVAGPGAAPQANAAALSGGFIQPTIDQLGADIDRQLQRQIGGAGGINTQAALANNLGGGRNQVQQGIANEAALDAFARGAGQIRLQDAQQRQQLEVQQAIANAGFAQQNQAQQLQAGLANQGAGLQGNQQLLSALLGSGQLAATGQQLNQAGAAQQLGALNPLLSLGLSPFGAQLAPLQALAGIIGGPTLLSQNTARETARGERISSGSETGGFGSLLGGLGGLGTFLGAI